MGSFPEGTGAGRSRPESGSQAECKGGHTLMVKRPGKTRKGISINSSWFLTCGGLDVRVPFGALFDIETSFPSGKCLYYGTGTSQTLGGTALSPQHMLRLVLDYRPWLCVSLWFTWAGQGQVSPRPTL